MPERYPMAPGKATSHFKQHGSSATRTHPDRLQFRGFGEFRGPFPDSLQQRDEVGIQEILFQQQFAGFTVCVLADDFHDLVISIHGGIPSTKRTCTGVLRPHLKS